MTIEPKENPGSLPRVSIGQCSSAGPKPRNDDSYGVAIPKGALLETKGIAMAIADGMSTSEAAKVASEMCVRSFLEDYFCTHESWTVKRSAAQVLNAVNRWLHGQSQRQFDSDQAMASTFSGLVLKAGEAHIFHAGDSRILHISAKTTEQLTTDHRIRAGRNNSYLARAVGIGIELEVDYRTISVAAGDVFVFTSDGVHEYVPAATMAKMIEAEPGDLDAAAKAIVESARAAGSDDNMTCQIVRVDDPGRPNEAAFLRRLSALPFPPELAPGMSFEGYQIIAELHASKRSQVYLATNQTTGEKVAIKTPSVNFEDDPAYLELFTREEWIGRRLRNPNVVRVIEPNRERRSLYYVTEFIEGQTLRQWMDANTLPGLADVRAIADQIASGLRAFHRKDMVHQDLKPENIIIDKHGTVKIVDFGSTRVAGLEEAAPGGTPHGPLGTVDYTAPECVKGFKATNRSDIYSLGVIVYEMLTGRLPNRESFKIKRATQRITPAAALQYNPAVPAWASAALDKAVHADPNQRYEVLSEFIADLTRPSPSLPQRASQPLIERNPATFWRTVAIVSVLLNIAFLVMLAR